MKPILFNTEMVKAILDRRKTQTRRVIPLKNNDLIFTGFVVSSTAKNREGYCAFGKNKEQDLEFIKPKYKVGDVLYVREKSYFVDCDCQCPWQCSPQGWYATDEVSYSGIRCSVEAIPSIHMRKEMARIFLRVTSVRVERLQDISVRDIEKETGWRREIYSYSNKNKAFLRDYCDFWNSTAKDGYKYLDNPYVFVYEFERVYDV